MFLPLGDDNSSRRITPFVVWLIFGVNAFVWFLQLSLGESFTYGFSAVPFEILNNTDLVGTRSITIAGERLPLEHSAGPQPIQLTLLTSMFMHGSWAHIIGNMGYLLIFGDQIEDALGHFRFLFFYLLCGVAASLAHVFFAPESIVPSLGASGAIAGVLGAYFITHPQNRVKVMYMNQIMLVPAYVVLGGWIVLQFISQVTLLDAEGGGVAYMAHIGGFLAGVPLFFLFRRRSY